MDEKLRNLAFQDITYDLIEDWFASRHDFTTFIEKSIPIINVPVRSVLNKFEVKNPDETYNDFYSYALDVYLDILERVNLDNFQCYNFYRYVKISLYYKLRDYFFLNTKSDSSQICIDDEEAENIFDDNLIDYLKEADIDYYYVRRDLAVLLRRFNKIELKIILLFLDNIKKIKHDDKDDEINLNLLSMKYKLTLRSINYLYETALTIYLLVTHIYLTPFRLHKDSEKMTSAALLLGLIRDYPGLAELYSSIGEDNFYTFLSIFGGKTIYIPRKKDIEHYLVKIQVYELCKEGVDFEIIAKKNSLTKEQVITIYSELSQKEKEMSKLINITL